MGLLTPLGIELYNQAGERVQRSPQPADGHPENTWRTSAAFRHFMHKEESTRQAENGGALGGPVHLPDLAASPRLSKDPSWWPCPWPDQVFDRVERIQIPGPAAPAACRPGGRPTWLEQLAGNSQPAVFARQAKFRYAHSPDAPHAHDRGHQNSQEETGRHACRSADGADESTAP